MTLSSSTKASSSSLASIWDSTRSTKTRCLCAVQSFSQPSCLRKMRINRDSTMRTPTALAKTPARSTLSTLKCLKNLRMRVIHLPSTATMMMMMKIRGSRFRCRQKAWYKRKQQSLIGRMLGLGSSSRSSTMNKRSASWRMSCSKLLRKRKSC